MSIGDKRKCSIKIKLILSVDFSRKRKTMAFTELKNKVLRNVRVIA
jgi:hypothetical protein